MHLSLHSFVQRTNPYLATYLAQPLTYYRFNKRRKNIYKLMAVKLLLNMLLFSLVFSIQMKFYLEIVTQ